MSAIKIISSYSGEGGSTEAFILLCQLFNDRGLDATFYGRDDWYRDKCRSGHFSDLKISPSDCLITHNYLIPWRPPCKIIVLSCHEKEAFPIQQYPTAYWDKIHFVSNNQKKWHGPINLPTSVIPNILPNLKRHHKKVSNVAGVIGSLDPHKQTHLSIERALQKGFTRVLLFGKTDHPYYEDYVKPYVDQGIARYMGFFDDKQAMYDQINCVFHSSKSECASYIEYECHLTGTDIDILDSAKSDGEMWDNDRIFNAWMTLLATDDF